MRQTDHDLMRGVARHILSYPYRIWGYGEGIALEALIHAGDHLNEPRYLAFVSDLMTQWLAARQDVPYADHVAPGSALLMVYERTRAPALLDRARALADLYGRMPRIAGDARLHRPDHADFHAYVYVDCMDFDAPFLCHLARVTGEARYFDLAVECLLGHAHVLWDDAHGLFYHLYDAEADRVNGAFWGRGNGWASLGMVGTLERLPLDHPGYGEIAKLYRRHITALVAAQTSDGNWHTVLDDAATYLEGSLPPMFYCSLVRGMKLGALSEDHWPAAALAGQAFRARLDDSGCLLDVSQASPPGTAAHYAAIPTGGPYPWGQGPALEALLLGASRTANAGASRRST